MKSAFCVFVLLCLTYVSIVSSLQTPKSCAEYAITAKEPFIKEFYNGIWYSHQLYDYPGYDCFVEKRTPRTDGNSDVTDILIRPDHTQATNFDGRVKYDYPYQGIYEYVSAANPDFSGTVYTILKTDYLFYTIVTRCEDNEDGSEVELYVSSRFRYIPSFIKTRIDAVLSDHGFDSNPIITMDVLSCPLWINW